MAKNLRQQMMKSTVWSFASNMTIQVLRFAGSIILARLLLPEHFGLVAMVTIINAMAQTLVNSGMSASLIQKKEIGQADYSTVFYFNILIAIVLTMLIIACAPLIADFYREPKLIAVVRWLSTTIIFYALTLIQRTQLRRNLNFRAIFWGESIGVFAGLVAGIIAALHQMGAYAIVIQIVTTPAISLIAFWLQTRWLPDLLFSKGIFFKHWKFSSRLLMTSLINSIFENIYNVVIGRFFPAAQLGLFSKARSLQQLSVKGITASFDNVLFAGLSKIQDDNEKLKYAYKKILRMLAFIVFPVMAILAGSADQFIVVLLGEEWAPSAIYLKWMCLAGAVAPLNMVNLKITLIKGNSKLFFRIAMAKKFILACLVAIAITLNQIEAYLGVIIIHAFISYAVHVFYGKKFINYGPAEQILNISKTLMFSFIVYIMAIGLNTQLKNFSLLVLLLQVMGGVVVYFLQHLFFNRSYLQEVRDYMKEIRNK